MRRWRPSKAQKADFIEKCNERDSLRFISSNGPIRTGDEVSFYSMNKGQVLDGIIKSHSYGIEKGQHTFTVDLGNNEILLVKGRNLYPNLLKHKPAL